MTQITTTGKTISQFITELEKLRQKHGDLLVLSDRFRQLTDAAIDIAFIREPKNKREVRKFWSEYYSESEKGKKCFRIW